MSTAQLRHLRTAASAGVLLFTLAATGAAWAQTAPAAPAQQEQTDDSSQVDEVVVTGFRLSLRSALSTKRNANVMVDAINAEDIADFPDANLAESLQRLPGVSIDRDNGEGRTITVRGLGSDFTRVRLNGVEALSTAGASISGDNPNRGRGFDFNTFASELFNSLKVQKTASAETEEGSLGATVDLQTGRPFDFSGPRLGLSVQDAYYENGESHNPRVAALVSDRWDFNHLGEIGLIGSVAYNKRDQTVDSYQRQAGQSDYTYRGATFAGTPNIAAGTSIQTRQGFAAPTGTPCNNGVIPGVNITNISYCDALRGSNLAAYNLINSPIGSTLRNNNATGTAAGTTVAPGSLVRIPALPTLNQQALSQERIGHHHGLPVASDRPHHDRYRRCLFQAGPGLDQLSDLARRPEPQQHPGHGRPGDLSAGQRQCGRHGRSASRPLRQLHGAGGDGDPGRHRLRPTAVRYDPSRRHPVGLQLQPQQPGAVRLLQQPQSSRRLHQRPDWLGSALRPDRPPRSSGCSTPASAPTARTPTIWCSAMSTCARRLTKRASRPSSSKGTVTLNHEFTDTLRVRGIYGESRSINKSQRLTGRVQPPELRQRRGGRRLLRL